MSYLLQTQTLIRLHDLGIISLQGPDAMTFANQLFTNNFVNQETSKASLSAFCQANGRMIASFIAYVRATNELHLITPLDILPKLLNRLKMYVLRRKVVITDVSNHYGIVGVLDPLSTATWWALDKCDQHTCIHLPSLEGMTRQLFIMDKPRAEAEGTINRHVWDYYEAISAQILVGSTLTEQFIPQMLNYDALEGINFHKGCYPGQEVIARSAFRGQVKRRLFLIRSAYAWQTQQELTLRIEKEDIFFGLALRSVVCENNEYITLVVGNGDILKEPSVCIYLNELAVNVYKLDLPYQIPAYT